MMVIRCGQAVYEEADLVCSRRNTPPFPLALGNPAGGNSLRPVLHGSGVDALDTTDFVAAGMGHGAGKHFRSS
jgi:hypothetical protein